MELSQLKMNLRSVIERYRNVPEFTGEVCRDVMASDCLYSIEQLEEEKAMFEEENKKLKEQIANMSKVSKPVIAPNNEPYFVDNMTGKEYQTEYDYAIKLAKDLLKQYPSETAIQVNIGFIISALGHGKNIELARRKKAH